LPGVRQKANSSRFIDDQVQFEAEEPDDRGLATSGSPGKDPMLMDAWIAADCE